MQGSWHKPSTSVATVKNQTFYLTTGLDMHWAGFAFTVDRERSAWPFVWLLSTVTTSTLKVKLRSFTAKKTKNGETSWCLVFQKLHVAMVP